MSFMQIFLLITGSLVIIFLVKRFMMIRSLKHYSPGEAKNLFKRNNIILLDVRTSPERKRNYIKGSLHIPLNEIRNRINELNKIKEKEIVCYCATGNRSISAASLLKKNGFKSANLKGGIAAWN